MEARAREDAKVSILIPVYNRKNYIADCIQSALNQTYQNYEIVIVDNASDDGTWEICQQYSSRDQRIRIFRNNNNIGPVLNWKRCIDEARGSYGKLLFSDDLLDPDFLKETLPFFNNKEVGFVFTSVLIGKKPGEGQICYQFAGQTGIFPASRFTHESLFAGDVPFSPGCAIFRMEGLRKILANEVFLHAAGAYSEHGAGPDLLFYLLTTQMYNALGHVCKPLCFFRDHEGSITISDDTHSLQKCYRVTKLAFAKKYLDKHEQRECCAHIWHQVCKEQGHWGMPSSVMADYTNNEMVVSIADILSMKGKRYINKIKRSIKNRRT